jgi:Gas vesicle protein K
MSPQPVLQVAPATHLQTLEQSKKTNTGLAPLLLTIVELIRQLMEAQVIRRMEAAQLSEADLDRAAAGSLRLIRRISTLI